MGGNAREPGRRSSSRLLALIGSFSGGVQTMSLSELAARSELPVSTAHRLVGELCDWGALERNSEGRYQIGARLWQIGSLAPQYRNLRAVAVPYMEDLYEVTHENVALAVRDGERALYIDHLAGRRSVGTARAVGQLAPLHATGVGKVILAFSEPELLESVIGRRLQRCTPFTILNPRQLVESVTRTRESQLGYSIQEMALGRCSVAAPIFGVDDNLVGSIAVVARSSTDVKRLAPTVLDAAARVTRTLPDRISLADQAV